MMSKTQDFAPLNQKHWKRTLEATRRERSRESYIRRRLGERSIGRTGKSWIAKTGEVDVDDV